MDRIGVIGGTGLISIDIKGQHQDFLLSKDMSVVRIDDINAETEFGIVPLRCITIDYKGTPKELIFLQRHHNQGDANKPPHMINHKANIKALEASGCEIIVSVLLNRNDGKGFPPWESCFMNAIH